MASKTQRRYAEQVRAQTEDKFGPQVQALAALLNESRSTRDSTIQTAKGTGAAISSAASRRIPIAGREAQQAVGYLEREQGRLPQGEGSIAQASQRDFSGARGRLQEQMLRTQTELGERALDAQSGVAAATRQAQNQYGSDAGKIRGQLVDLAGAQGSYAAAELAKLLEGDRDRRSATNRNIRSTRASSENSERSSAQSERNSIRSSGIDPDTGQPIPGGKLDPKGKDKVRRLPGGAKLKDVTQHAAVNDAVETSRLAAKRLIAAKNPDPLSVLISGRESSTIEDDDGQKLKVPGVKAAKARTFAMAAYDLESQGYLSRDTVKALHKAGYSAKELGYPTKAPVRERAPVAPGANGQLRPN